MAPHTYIIVFASLLASTSSVRVNIEELDESGSGGLLVDVDGVDVSESDQPPSVSALFGFNGETCRGGSQKCVLVADSYGLMRPARLDGRDLSVRQAALALLQDQHVLNQEINGTTVTVDNVASLVGIEAIARADGRPVSFEQLDSMLGSGSDLRVSWRPVESFAGDHSHSVAMVQLSSGEDWGWKSMKKWAWNATKKAAAVAAPTVIKKLGPMVEGLLKNSEMLTQILNQVKKLTSCLDKAPNNQKWTDVIKIAKEFMSDPKAAIKSVDTDLLSPAAKGLKDFMKEHYEGGDNKTDRIPVIMGRSVADSNKCVRVFAQHVQCSPVGANHDHRLHPKPNTGHIEFTVSTARVGGGEYDICVRRTDSREPWDFNLVFTCHATGYSRNIRSLTDGTWKNSLWEGSWLLLDELVSQSGMEVGKCISETFLQPLQEKIEPVVMTALVWLDTHVRAFLGQMAKYLQKALKSFVASVDDKSQSLFGKFDTASVQDVVSSAVGTSCLQAIVAAKNGTGSRVDTMPGIGESFGKSARQLVHRLGKQLETEYLVPKFSQSLDLLVGLGHQLLLSIEGHCGVVPEIGGLLCNALTVPMSHGLSSFKQPLLNGALKFIRHIFEVLGDQVGEWLSTAVVKFDGARDDAEEIAEGLKQQVSSFVKQAIDSTWLKSFLPEVDISLMADEWFDDLISLVGNSISGALMAVGPQMKQCIELVHNLDSMSGL